MDELRGFLRSWSSWCMCEWRDGGVVVWSVDESAVSDTGGLRFDDA